MTIVETTATETVVAVPDAEIITAEIVAKTIAGIEQIGVAHRVLQEEGYAATIVANRITIAGVIEARLTQANGSGFWQVYALNGTPPVWTVGSSCVEASSWIGCE